MLLLAAGTGRSVHLIADPVAPRTIVTHDDHTVEVAEPGLNVTALVK